jgi:endo-1,4-beta-mannosidase
VDTHLLERLVAVADLAGRTDLAIVPTLFTGHMSGVNWVPPWALGGSDGDDRFRIVSAGRVAAGGLRNWYTDPVVGGAQALFAREAAAALAGHEALWAWDLGNENSNCVVPPSRSTALDWLERIVSAIRTEDATVPITVGLHMEDLEEDRKLGPQQVSETCDFLSMHGYPIYARWAEGPTDEQLLPFLARLTRWLGNGRDVLFSEFGLPTYRRDDPSAESARRKTASMLVDEQTAAAYTGRALLALREAGCIGAMLWCYTDYDPSIWETPPLDLAVHERFFGLWRADGSPKPAVTAVTDLVGAARLDSSRDDEWIDVDTEEFSLDPRQHLPRLYRRYRDREVT